MVVQDHQQRLPVETEGLMAVTVLKSSQIMWDALGRGFILEENRAHIHIAYLTPQQQLLLYHALTGEPGTYLRVSRKKGDVYTVDVEINEDKSLDIYLSDESEKFYIVLSKKEAADLRKSVGRQLDFSVYAEFVAVHTWFSADSFVVQYLKAALPYLIDGMGTPVDVTIKQYRKKLKKLLKQTEKYQVSDYSPNIWDNISKLAKAGYLWD